MKKFGIEIKFCHNLKQYNKLIHSLKEFPNDLIVTVDDDIYYQYDCLEKLYNAYLENPNFIHCHRAHKILFDKNNDILPYTKWIQCINNKNTESSYLNFFTGVGGVLYKSKLLYKDIYDENLFMELCPKADDIWFWAMAVLNGTKINVVKENISNIIDLGYSHYNRLYDINVLENYNDIQLNNILEYYKDSFKDKIRPYHTSM